LYESRHKNAKQRERKSGRFLQKKEKDISSNDEGIAEIQIREEFQINTPQI
jgi:hypothetical protein